MTNMETLRRYIVYLEAMQAVTESAAEDGGLEVGGIKKMLERAIRDTKNKLALLEHYGRLAEID